MTVLEEEDQDSTGAGIEPQANDEELLTEIKYSEQGEKNVDNFVTVLNISDKSSETPSDTLETDKVIISDVSDSILSDEESTCSTVSEAIVAVDDSRTPSTGTKPDTCPTKQSSILRFFPR